MGVLLWMLPYLAIGLEVFRLSCWCEPIEQLDNELSDYLNSATEAADQTFSAGSPERYYANVASENIDVGGESLPLYKARFPGYQFFERYLNELPELTDRGETWQAAVAEHGMPEKTEFYSSKISGTEYHDHVLDVWTNEDGEVIKKVLYDRPDLTFGDVAKAHSGEDNFLKWSRYHEVFPEDSMSFASRLFLVWSVVVLCALSVSFLGGIAVLVIWLCSFLPSCSNGVDYSHLLNEQFVYPFESDVGAEAIPHLVGELDSSQSSQLTDSRSPVGAIGIELVDTSSSPQIEGKQSPTQTEPQAFRSALERSTSYPSMGQINSGSSGRVLEPVAAEFFNLDPPSEHSYESEGQQDGELGHDPWIKALRRIEVKPLIVPGASRRGSSSDSSTSTGGISSTTPSTPSSNSSLPSCTPSGDVETTVSSASTQATTRRLLASEEQLS